MNNPPMDRETMMKVFKYGTYYNPASKRYGEGANVVCDRCHRTGLDISIGLQHYDLCLICIQDISRSVKKETCIPPYAPEIRTRMLQGQYMTNMVQNQFRNDDVKSYMRVGQFKNLEDDDCDDCKTFMIQSQFRY